MLPLKQEIIYGPVHSRRLGRSLGINLLPTRRKVCSFDCVYCQYGRTRAKTLDPGPEGFPTLDEVIAAVETALKSGPDFDTFTFSGNGEPTLHPHWPEIVETVRQLRDRYRPAARLALLSNSSTVARVGVRATLARLEAPIMKLEAGDEATFAALNCPASGISLEAIVEGLAQVPGLSIQSLMVEGAVTNSAGPAFEHWLETLARLKPVQVQVYSTDRPVPEAGVERVPPGRLQQIAARAVSQTGLDVRAYWRQPGETMRGDNR
jgi:wyosine [tRNA(Phe)-imidazoG37] synthetase (radical SAM superfamily)